MKRRARMSQKEALDVIEEVMGKALKFGERTDVDEGDASGLFYVRVPPGTVFTGLWERWNDALRTLGKVRP